MKKKHNINILSGRRMLWLLLPFAFLISVAASLSPSPAQAASIAFTWKDVSTITASGVVSGNLGEATPGTKTGTDVFQGRISGSDKCNYLSIRVNLDNNTGVVDNTPSGGSVGGTGTVPCYADALGISNNHTIKGNRPGGTAVETDAEKQTHISLGTPSPPSKAPKSVTFVIKNSSGKTIATTPVTGEGNGNSDTPNITQGTIYQHFFPLEGSTSGTKYTVCFSAIDSKCHAFTKFKYKRLGLSYGYTTDVNSINIRVPVVTYVMASQNVTIDAKSAQLKKDGKVIQTIKTTSYNYKGDNSALGTIVKLGPIDLTGTFKNVAPGDYQICIPSNNQCVNVTKKNHLPTDPSPITFKNIVTDPFNLASTYNDQTGSHDPNATCETGGFGLNWIICPIFNTVADTSDWLFEQVVQPFLRTAPVSTSSTDCDHGQGDCSYQIWSNFRIYGDIFLIIALLVVVFGQSIGGGLIDAYTAKKILPRLLAAAILINLSIYIVAGLVDIVNIIGGSLGALITGPISQAGAFHFSPSGIQAGSLTALFGAASISGVALDFLKFAAIKDFGPFLLLMILMPILFGLIAAFLTLIVRKGLILALILISPVAFALYCLPNTEKYFRQWWELLFKTLLVYPIIIVIFAIADVLTVTTMRANGGHNVASPVVLLVAFALQFLPLLAIPYSFRLAGGVLARAHELLTTGHRRMQEGIKGNINDPTSLRNRLRNKAREGLVDRRANLDTSWSNHPRSGVKRGLGRLLGGGPGIYEKKSQIAQQRLQLMKTTQDLDNDSFIRAATIPVGSLNRLRDTSRFQGKDEAGNNSGFDQWQSADGMWHTENTIKRANRQYGSAAAKVGAFSRVLDKADSKDVASQNEAYKDFIGQANELGWDSTFATGQWQGVAIPYKGIRMDMRRFGIKGEKGQLYDGGVNHGDLLFESGNARKYDFISETEGTPAAIESAIRWAYTSPDATDEDRAKAVRSAKNMEEYTYGAGRGPAEAEAARSPEEGAMPQGLREAYATSSGAAWKNTKAFQDAVTRLAGDQELNRHLGLAQRRQGGNGGSGSTGGGNGNGGGGPTIITPGSPGFNIPPGSRP